jgi:homospermidine synthase
MEKIVYSNKILILGFGAISKATLPLLFKHIEISPDSIEIISADVEENRKIAEMHGVILTNEIVTRENYKALISNRLSKGDLLVNLTAETSSIDIARFCLEEEILYLDTCIELWPQSNDFDMKTTYALHQKFVEFKHEMSAFNTTSLSSHGANPGIVSLLVKKALVKISEANNVLLPDLNISENWAKLAYELGVTAIHINERDTQVAPNHDFSEHNFINTWSPQAMCVECTEPAEMVLGSHEPLPKDAKTCNDNLPRSIYFNKAAKDVSLETWLPHTKYQTGYVVNHSEPITIANLLTYKEKEYNPTVCFVYQPCPAAVTSLDTEDIYKKDFVLKGKVITHEISEGYDELGVLIETTKYGTYWLGSLLTIERAREIDPTGSATSLQVAGGVISGICWIIKNQREGVVESEDILDYESVLRTAEPYWGKFIFTKKSS